MLFSHSCFTIICYVHDDASVLVATAAAIKPKLAVTAMLAPYPAQDKPVIGVFV
jgi:hypothetical protein